MRLVSIGDNNVDTYSSGFSYAGGNCPNVAAYSVMNGFDSTYIGVLGDDVLGSFHLRSMTAAGIDVSHVRIEHGTTSNDTIVSDNGDRIFTCYDRSIIDAYPISLSEEEFSICREADILHTSVYSVFAPGELKKISSLYTPLSYDFSVEWKKGVSAVGDQSAEDLNSFIIPNLVETVCPLVEFAFFSCGNVSLDETIQILKKATSLGSKIAIGTRGMEGSYCYNGHTLLYQPAYASKTIDTLGAGDSFISRFLCSYIPRSNWFTKMLAATNDSISAENQIDFDEKILSACLAESAIFASRTCSIEGAFGFGERLSI